MGAIAARGARVSYKKELPPQFPFYDESYPLALEARQAQVSSSDEASISKYKKNDPSVAAFSLLTR